jgi:hypothetical protein
MVAIHLVVALAQCAYPYDNDQSYITFGVSHEIASGENPWAERHVLTPPFTIPAYGPALHALGALGYAVFGRHFWWLRLASLAGFVLSLVALSRFARSRSESTSLAWWAALIYVDLGPVVGASASGRGDFLALGLMTFGASVLLEAPATEMASYALAGLLCGAAPLVKQLYVSAIAVGTLFCLLRRGGRNALVFLVAGAAPMMVTFAILQWRTGGGAWAIMVVYPSLAKKTLAHLVLLLIHLKRDPLFVLSLATLALGLIAAWRLRRRFAWTRDDRFAFLVAWLPLAVAMSLFTGMRTIANGYWLELCFVVAALLARLIPTLTPSLRVVPRLATALGVLFLGGGLVGHARALHGVYLEWQAIPYYESLVDLVQRRTSPDDKCFTEYSDIPERAGRSVLFNDYLLYGVTTARNRQLVQSSLDEGRFAILLLQPYAANIYDTSRYQRIATALPFPTKVWAVAPYLRRDLLTPADVALDVPGGPKGVVVEP